jgi:hypothetical protein
MPKDLQEFINDRLSPLAALSNASRLTLHAAEEAALPVRVDKKIVEAERDYLAMCQKLEQLVERKRRAEEETVDVAALHQELCLIGSRIQREPHDRAHEEDYLSVLRRTKETLWHKIEAEDLKGEFQKLHFELLTLGHILGFERSTVEQPSSDTFDSVPPEEMNLSDVERQIADLQAQIRGLHDQR